MAVEWRVKTLDQLGRVVTGKTPPSTVADAFGGQTPFVTPSDMDGARIISRTTRNLSASGQATVKNAAIPKGAVMVSCIGSDMGKTAMAGADCATNQQINSIIIDTDDSPLFVYYNLSTRKSEIRGSASGSAQPILNKSAFGCLEIELPPPAEQRAIAHVLGTLDDKIELNRRRNQTLEAMARALFKNWFVDFGPVRAKMEGREPYLPADLWQLFPDRLDDEGKPEGWRRSTIGSEVTVCGGSTPSTKEPAYWENGEHHWATPKDLSALTFPVLLDTDRKITDAGIAKISSGLLPVGTVLLSSRAPIGYLAIAEVPTAINQGFIAMKCDSTLPNVFVLFWCRENMDLILGNANGSTFQEISKNNFRPIPVVVPPEPVLDAFRERTGPLYRHIVENERESRTLAQLRDTLLPKLTSGELRVKDAERFIERAT